MKFYKLVSRGVLGRPNWIFCQQNSHRNFVNKCLGLTWAISFLCQVEDHASSFLGKKHIIFVVTAVALVPLCAIAELLTAQRKDL